jgi:hypothetical protein
MNWCLPTNWSCQVLNENLISVPEPSYDFQLRVSGLTHIADDENFNSLPSNPTFVEVSLFIITLATFDKYTQPIAMSENDLSTLALSASFCSLLLFVQPCWLDEAFNTAILPDEGMYPDCIGMDLQVCSHSDRKCI